MSESADKKSSRRHTLSQLCVGLAALIVIIFVFWPTIDRISPERGRRFCQDRLKGLAIAMRIYAGDYNGASVPIDKWCDALAGIVSPDGSERHFRCPMAHDGRCHYAMNPRADAQSAPDVVLLFESTGGWNQAGGPELLTTKYHEGEGCGVLFVDGHVEFVKTQDIPRLKWEGKVDRKEGGTESSVSGAGHP